MYAGVALHSPCRLHTMLTRHALKKHTQPLWFYSNFRISNFDVCLLVFTSDPPSLRASGHRPYRAWVYFFSTRRKLVCLYPIKFAISTVLIHWQSLSLGTYMYAGVALHSPCRLHTMLTRHALKKHTQPLWFYSNFRISNFDVCLLVFTSDPPTLCASVPLLFPPKLP